MGALKIWNGSAWEYIGNDGAPGTAGAMVQLYDSTLGGSAASFDITSISGAYTHLRLYTSLRGDAAVDALNSTITLNNDGSALYNQEETNVQDTTVFGQRVRGGTAFTHTWLGAGANQNADNFGSGTFDFVNYASAHRKMVQGQYMTWNDNSGTPYGTMSTFVGHYASATAISRITIGPGSGNFVAGSRVTLYGIL